MLENNNNEEKVYTKKEAQDYANNMLYEKAKSTYQVAINKMATDFGIDKYKRHSFDIDKDDVKMYLENPLKYPI